MTSLIQTLQDRGIIAQMTDEKGLLERLAEGPIALYCGFDPTADSLHVGHLVPLICLKRFQLAGHRPVVLLGGATGMIGDPSFKATERKLKNTETLQEWIAKIKLQLSLFLDFDCSAHRAIVTNNYQWFGSMNVLPFLRDIGKYFAVNQMIHKDAVKQRINRDDSGISFTEFSYNLLQGYDFTYLNQQYGVILQIGGSDQWGNIISGIDLTRRMHHQTVYGLTVPLITKSNGIKFGKTEGDTIWLDQRKTSPYKFYQFWLNTQDSDVYRFLNLFTFLDFATINAMEQEERSSRSAQFILAEEVTRMVHGTRGLTAAQRITTSLFHGGLSDLKEDDFAQLAQDGLPTIRLRREKRIDLPQALVEASLVPSRGQARTMITANAITINNIKPATSTSYVFSNDDRLYGRYTLLRRGKKHYCLIRWEGEDLSNT